MTTWSPQSTCGVKLGLCLPRRMLAMIVASRPTTSPSASIRCHFFSTSAGLTDLVVFISAFMAADLSKTRGAAQTGPDETTIFMGTLEGRRLAGQMAGEAPEVKQMRGFAERYHLTA